jgi:hypothetical protein
MGVSVEPVPQHERTPTKRYQVVVDGSIISRHRTKNKARDRAREAKGRSVDRRKAITENAIEASKIGSPVDASLDTMNEMGMDDYVTGNHDEEPVRDDDEADPFPFFGGKSGEEQSDSNPLEFEDSLLFGGDE